jgi:hypothetical protein
MYRFIPPPTPFEGFEVGDFSVRLVKLDQLGTHFTTDEIIETLKNMGVVNIEDTFYAAAYGSSQVCTAFNSLFDLGLDKKFYRPKDLRKIIRNISN